jgi:HEAT repeat protein
MEELNTLIDHLVSGDDRLAEAAVRKLPAYGQEALKAIKELLDSEQPDERWWATWAISSMRDPQVPPLLIEKLKDADPTVRQCAALALRHQPDMRAIPSLIDTLTDDDPITVHLAAAALTAIGPEAVPPLLDILEKSPIPIQLEVLRSLAMIGDERSVPALFEALQNNSAIMEHWASEGLERMGIGMTFFKP